MSSRTQGNEWIPQAHRGSVLGLSALVFLILFGYAIVRPATESLFVEAHSAEALPKAWLLVALSSVIIVSAYSHWAARIDLVAGFGVISSLSALSLALLWIAGKCELPGARYALFVWKDIYIVLLVEIFWSFANQVMPIGKASRVYGLFLIIGGLGGILGNLIGGELAPWLGTENVLLVAHPLLVGAQLGCVWLSMSTGAGRASRGAQKSNAGLGEGLRVLLGSRVLILLLMLIGITQVVINLVDYQTQIALQNFYPDTDERTQITGRIYAAVDMAAMGLNLCTGPILRVLGVPFVMMLIPALLLGCVIGAAALPRMITVGITKVASKAFDYSIFRASKELFYIPLSHAEKTQGKAFVDMMAYRVSKGLVSLLLLTLGAISTLAIWGLTGLMLCAWIWCVSVLVRSSPEISKPSEV
jgi:AAA family ATP:ADP antiporter